MAAMLNSCLNKPAETPGENSLIHPADNPPAEKVDMPELAGTVYYFVPGNIDTSTCELPQLVDGGGWHIIFVNDSSFLKIEYYLAGAYAVRKGLYHWQNDTLRFHYDSLSIEQSMEIDQKTTGDNSVVSFVPVNKVRYSPGIKSWLTFKQCSDGKLYLSGRSTLDSFTGEGVKKDTLKREMLIRKLKEEKLWEMLEME